MARPSEFVESLKKLMKEHCDINNTSHDKRYLRLTGGTLSGGLMMDGGQSIYMKSATGCQGIYFKRTTGNIAGIGIINADSGAPTLHLGVGEDTWGTSAGLNIFRDEIKWNGKKILCDGEVASATHNHDSSYLKLSGGAVTGRITKTVSPTPWYGGRVNALIASTQTCNASSFYPLLSAKAVEGSWELGAQNKNLYIVNISDINFNNSSNVCTATYSFGADGTLTATKFSGSLSGNAATATALTTSAGSSTKPVYFSGGKPVACSLTPSSIGVTGVTASNLNYCQGLKYNVQNEFDRLEVLLGKQSRSSTYKDLTFNIGDNYGLVTTDYCDITVNAAVRNGLIGNYNAIIGWKNKTSFDSSIAANYAFGSDNRLGGDFDNPVETYQNATRLSSCMAIGMGNQIDAGTNLAMLIGTNNQIYHRYRFNNGSTDTEEYSIAIGNRNILGTASSANQSQYMSSYSNFILGIYNQIYAANKNAAIGHNNVIHDVTNTYLIGNNNTTYNDRYSFGFALGSGCSLYGGCSLATGRYTGAGTGQTAFGHYNSVGVSNSESGTSTGTALTLGNGTSSSRSNAFRITGDGYVFSAKGSISSGADYAEYFEYADENPMEEDRVGYFITFDSGRNIRIATPDDDYILGISSGNPVIIGNGDECWSGRFERDLFDRPIIENTTDRVTTGETDDDGNEIYKTIPITKWKENPNYDPEKEYTQRSERPEWEAVGMLGVLAVYDDGNCTIDGYCTVGEGGIAVPCEYVWGPKCYRVLERLSNNVIRVLFRN